MALRANYQKYCGGYAASASCTTMATSSEAAHRGQRCPGTTRACFPTAWMTAGTVWVQIGQCAIPLTPFSLIGFMAFYPLTTSDARSRTKVVAIYKLFQTGRPITSHQPPVTVYVTMAL